MEEISKYLRDLGLTDNEVKAYIFLTRLRSAKVGEIVDSLKTNRLQTYRALQKLLDRGLIEVSMGRPRRYVAVPIDRYMDSLLKEASNRIKDLEEKRTLLRKKMDQTFLEQMEEPLAKFRIIQGRKNIHKFRHKLFTYAEKEIWMITTMSGLTQWVSFGADDILEKRVKKGIAVRMISEIDRQNIEAAKRFLEFSELRHMKMPSIAWPTIVDDKEVLIYLPVDDTVRLKAEEDVSLWTSSLEIVKMMKAFYNTMWSDADDARSKIKEIETGKPLEVFQLVRSPEEASSKIKEVISTSKQDLLLLLPEIDFNRFMKEFNLRKIRDRGVEIRILTPMIRRRLEAQRELAALYKIRHMEPDMLKIVMSDKEKIFVALIDPFLSLTGTHKHIIFSNSESYVNSFRALLEECWKNAPTVEDRMFEAKTGIQASFNLFTTLYATFLWKAVKETVEDEAKGILMDKTVEWSLNYLFQELELTEFFTDFDITLKRIARLYEANGSKTTLTSPSENIFVLDIQNCPIQNLADCYPAVCELENKFLQALFSRFGKIEMKTPHSPMQGNKYCRHIFQLKPKQP